MKFQLGQRTPLIGQTEEKFSKTGVEGLQQAGKSQARGLRRAVQPVLAAGILTFAGFQALQQPSLDLTPIAGASAQHRVVKADLVDDIIDIIDQIINPRPEPDPQPEP